MNVDSALQSLPRIIMQKYQTNEGALEWHIDGLGVHWRLTPFGPWRYTPKEAIEEVIKNWNIDNGQSDADYTQP